MKICTACFLLLSCLSLVAVAQKADDLRTKYGPPNGRGYYTVRPEVAMVVTFDRSGTIAEALIAPSDAETSSATMAVAVAKAIVDEVAPPAIRGRYQKTAEAAVGCTRFSFLEYERVVIQTVTRCDRQGGGVYYERLSWK